MAKVLIGMLHVGPLPGSPGHSAGMDELIAGIKTGVRRPDAPRTTASLTRSGHGVSIRHLRANNEHSNVIGDGT